MPGRAHSIGGRRPVCSAAVSVSAGCRSNPSRSSAGGLIQRTVPAARVVSAFKNHSAETLQDIAAPLEGDVLLCGNDAGARAEVAALVGLLPGLRAVDAGGIANARYLEAITALLL